MGKDNYIKWKYHPIFSKAEVNLVILDVYPLFYLRSFFAFSWIFPRIILVFICRVFVECFPFTEMKFYSELYYKDSENISRISFNFVNKMRTGNWFTSVNLYEFAAVGCELLQQVFLKSKSSFLNHLRCFSESCNKLIKQESFTGKLFRFCWKVHFTKNS